MPCTVERLSEQQAVLDTEISVQLLQRAQVLLNAAALTYVAATLQAILTLLYYVMRYAGSRD